MASGIHFGNRFVIVATRDGARREPQVAAASGGGYVQLRHEKGRGDGVLFVATIREKGRGVWEYYFGWKWLTKSFVNKFTENDDDMRVVADSIII